MWKSEHLIYPVQKGHINLEHTSILPELLFRAYDEISIKSLESPVIIAEPTPPFSEIEKEEIERILFSIFRVPSVTYVSSAVLALCSHRKSEGIVVMAGDQIGSVTVVPSSSSPLLFNPKDVASASATLIKALESIKGEAKLDVVLAGGQFLNAKYAKEFRTTVRKNTKRCKLIFPLDIYTVVNGGVGFSEMKDVSKYDHRPQKEMGNEHHFYSATISEDYYWRSGREAYDSASAYTHRYAEYANPSSPQKIDRVKSFFKKLF